MPIDPRELVRGGREMVITEDCLCDRCRYNLRGLPRGGRCPECGLPIRHRASSKRFTDNLTQAPIFYLKALALGLGLTAAAAALFIALNVIGAFAASRWDLALLGAHGAAAVIWWAGVYIVTAQRPLTEGTIRDALLESTGLRQTNRFLQSSWALAALFQFMGMRTGSALPGYLAHGALVIATLSLVPLALQFSALADWAGDTAVSERFKVAAWAIAFFGIPKEIAVLLSPAGGVLAATVWFWSSLAEAIAQGVFLFGVYQLVGNAFWAISNASHAADAARRVADRNEDPTAHTECAYCGYSRRGVSPFAPCPECGRLEETVRQSGLATGPGVRRGGPAPTPVIPLEPPTPVPPRPVRRTRQQPR